MLNRSALLPVLFSLPCMKATLGSSSPCLTRWASSVPMVKVRSGSASAEGSSGPGPSADHRALH